MSGAGKPGKSTANVSYPQKPIGGTGYRGHVHFFGPFPTCERCGADKPKENR